MKSILAIYRRHGGHGSGQGQWGAGSPGFNQVPKHVPELDHAGFAEAACLTRPSTAAMWRVITSIASTVMECMDRFDGFVVLHGTDTMAYTASALSFMLEGLQQLS